MLNNTKAEQRNYKVDQTRKCRNRSSAIRCALSWSFAILFHKLMLIQIASGVGGVAMRKRVNTSSRNLFGRRKEMNSAATKASKMKIVSGNWNWVHVTTIGDIATIPISSLFKCKRCDAQHFFLCSAFELIFTWMVYIFFSCCCW